MWFSPIQITQSFLSLFPTYYLWHYVWISQKYTSQCELVSHPSKFYYSNDMYYGYVRVHLRGDEFQPPSLWSSVVNFLQKLENSSCFNATWTCQNVRWIRRRKIIMRSKYFLQNIKNKFQQYSDYCKSLIISICCVWKLISDLTEK